MNNRTGIQCLLLAAWLSVCLVPASHAANADKEAYDPARTYTGQFDSAKLYYHLKDSPKQRFLPGGFQETSFAESATCPEALLQLRNKGFWSGGLRSDGSCAANVPTFKWAKGNWLNFRKIGARR